MHGYGVSVKEEDQARCIRGQFVEMQLHFARLMAFPMLCLSCACIGAQEITPDSRTLVVRHNLLQLPNARAAAERLQTPVTLVWENKPLREGLADLSQSYELAIWLDRRMDPSQTLTLQFPESEDNVTLQDLFHSIANQLSADAGLVENVLYIGPAGTAAAVQWAAVRCHDQWMREHNAGNVELKPFEWPELSTPTSILEDLAALWKVQIEGDLPHDLLHAGQKGACTLATQLALLASGFDRAPTLLGPRTIAFEPFSSGYQWRFDYTRSDLSSSQLRRQELSTTLREISGTVRQRGQSVIVYGPTALHLRLLQPTAARKVTTDFQRQTWTLEVKNKPLSVVVDTLSQSLGLQVSWDATLSREARQKLVTFQVNEAVIDELLSAVADAAQLNISRDAMRVFIKP